METADIAIIGGGILGASIAYQIAQRSTNNVVLIERDTVAFDSSGCVTAARRVVIREFPIFTSAGPYRKARTTYHHSRERTCAQAGDG